MILSLLSAWALLNALCLLLDRLLFPGYRKIEIKKPVFIIGNARSGTTLFHRLLCADDDRFVHFVTWEILFPSLLQKRAIRALTTTYQRLFPNSFQRLAAWEDRQLQEIKKMHPIGVNKPEEDESLATAYGELASAEKSVDEEINAALAGSERVEAKDKLAALKAKMGIPS